MAEKTTIKIFIASAGEMEEERLQVDHVFTRLNKSHKHLFLDPLKYEYDTIAGSQPGFERIQDAITPKLIESQLAVFIFFSKIGKYTKEEYDHAIKENKKLFVFFKKGFSPELNQLETYQELLKFRENLNDTVLKKDYNELDNFDQQLYENLNSFLLESYPTKETYTSGETTALPSSIQDVIRDLTEKDKKIKTLEEQLALKPNNKADDELQRLIAEKEVLYKELRQSEEIIKQQAKDKEALEKQLTLQKYNDDFKAKALKAVEEKDYDTAENYLKESAKGSFSDAASTLSELAKVKKLQFQYGEALNYYEMAIRLSPENSLYQNEAGLVANDLGFYEKAIEFYEKAMAIDKKFLGEDHPNIAIRYNNLGSTYYNKGEYDKAIEFYEKSLLIGKQNLGEENPKIATRYNNLGGVYNSKGEYDKAIEFYEKAMVIDKKFHGEEHSAIARGYNNLGGAFFSKGKYDKAIEVLEKALKILKKIYGEEFPKIAIVYNNLGAAYDRNGEYDKAIEFYEKAMAIDKKFLGEDHPNIAIRYNNLGSTYYNKGEYARAISYYEQSLLILKKHLPSSHPNILTCQENMALVQAALDKQKKKKPGE